MKKSFVFLICAILFASTAFAQTNKAFKKGYHGSVELGFGTVNGQMKEGYIKSNTEVSPSDHDQPGEMVRLATVHGYSLGNGVFLGAGLGWDFELVDSAQYANVFADVKYNIKDASASPFVEGRAGYRFCTNAPRFDTEGVFVSAAAGVDFGRFAARLGYECCPIKQNYRTTWGYLQRKYYAMNQLSLSFAFNF